MVGSVLNSTTAAHLLPLTDNGGDLDGSLLVTEDSQKFHHGFIWNEEGCIVWNPNQFGIGVQRK